MKIIFWSIVGVVVLVLAVYDASVILPLASLLRLIRIFG